MPVVRYNDDGIRKIKQIIFQPSHRFDVEVVGRLVEQQHVRIAEKRLRKQYFHLHFRIEIRHQHGMILRRYVQLVEQRFRLRFGLPTAQFGEFTL